MMHLTIQQLVAQTDGELTGPSLTLVENHIAECETCWHEMERLAELDALLVSIITVDPGEAFFEDLAASVEAEISGKRKPTPRTAALPMPAPSPVPIAIQRPQRAAAPPAPAIPSPEPEAAFPASSSPEPEAVAPAPAATTPEPEVVFPAPTPIANLDAPAPPPVPIEPVGGWTPPAPGRQSHMAVEHGGAWTPPPVPAADPKPLTIVPVGGWTPPAPTPDDPFADLVLPPRSTVPPAPKPPPRPAAVTPPPMPPAPKPAPRPAAVTPPPMPVAPKPAPRPAAVTPPPTPVAPRLAPMPAASKPASAPRPMQATPALPVAPEPRFEQAPSYEPRRQSLAVPILIGVLAFIAGLVVAVIVVIRLAGPVGFLKNAPSTARSVNAPPEAPTEEPPAPPPARVVEPRHERSTSPVERAPAPAAPAAARPKRHAPPAATSPADDGALNAEPTVVVPVEKIHSETVAPVSPPVSEPVPAPAPPPAALGILCGMVLDSESHPVARAQVMMADVGVVVLTDRAGRFCLTAPAGERTLTVVALGFTTAHRLIALGKSTPEINIKLNSAAPFPTPP